VIFCVRAAARIPSAAWQYLLRSFARMRLWLRGERAFGVLGVTGGWQGGAGTPAAELSGSFEPAERAARQTTAATRESPPPATPPSLFGGEEPSPHASLHAAGLALPSADAPFDAPLLSSEEKQARLIAMDNNEVRGCTRCRLCESRTNTVFGEGDVDAKIMFIGEGPGENEDHTGRPFVGRAGEKLNDMIRAMGLSRQQVYIANIVKCRPPDNREPAPDEVATCTPYLQRQVEIIRPRVIVTLGRPATQFMLGKKISIGRVRGQWHRWRGIALMPTFHPAYILRNYTRETREAVWSDLKQVMAELKMTPAARGAAGAP
jgi:DNA polymerase